ncbi:peptidyl-prolyl cis-trans isomerase [Haloferula sp.]|uniref:peptidylprolyl isomerase n=1 Tax=Haloferula sp. TaxID=2497595 RepID=UPI003C776D8D
MKILRDPLIVFLLIGGGIFLLYSKVNPEEELDAANPDQIEITSDIQNMLVSEWSARWNRPPTPEEFKGLLDSYIKEELLFREASKLGLDQADSIIRRRLAQKMEFLTSDIVDLEDVSDETLQTFYQDNAEKYQMPTELGFQQIYFSTDKRDDAEADAAALLPSLNDGSMSFEQAVESADPTLLSPEFSTSELPLIGRQFGTEFAEALTDQTPGEWFGPVKSGYGFHLVKILERKDGHLPELATIREDVLNDYRYEQREKLNESMLEGLLEQYDVVIEPRIEEATETEETPEP